MHAFIARAVAIATRGGIVAIVVAVISGMVVGAETNTPELAPDPWNRFIGLLDQLRIPHDPAALEDAALEAMLHVVDRQAERLTEAEAENRRLAETGFWIPESSPPDPYPPGMAAEPQPLPPLRVEQWPENIVYIAVNGLHAGVGEAFREAANQSVTSKVTGLIVDLRQAGGRDFDSVDLIAACFTDAGTPIYQVNNLDGRPVREGQATQGIQRLETPTMLLVGNRTSGTAELLAAVLHPLKGVMLLGDRTAGDPYLRDAHRWSDDVSLWLPSASMQAIGYPDYALAGVEPQITVRHRPTGDYAARESFPESVTSDPVSARAVDLLIGLKAIQALP